VISFCGSNSLIYRFAVPVALVAGLSACATASDPGRMSVASLLDQPSFSPALQHTICIRTVTGGETTNPLWVSKVDSGDFQSALSVSMENAGLIAPPDACRYSLDVNLLGLSQPSFGLDMQVTSHVNYKVFDATAQPILLETISAPFTATFSDSTIGFVRIKRANEGSIRASISQFLQKLRELKVG
jgi:hypothetical protein